MLVSASTGGNEVNLYKIESKANLTDNISIECRYIKENVLIIIAKIHNENGNVGIPGDLVLNIDIGDKPRNITVAWRYAILKVVGHNKFANIGGLPLQDYPVKSKCSIYSRYVVIHKDEEEALTGDAISETIGEIRFKEKYIDVQYEITIKYIA